MESDPFNFETCIVQARVLTMVHGNVQIEGDRMII